MKRNLMFMASILMFAALISGGCAEKKAENSQQAIEQSKTMKNTDEQIRYLADQAQAFLNSKEYSEAMNAAQYILTNLDAKSEKAKDVLAKAMDDMKKVTAENVEDMKNKMKKLGQ